MKKEFKSEKNAYRFAATTTQEELAGRISACDGAVCKFNNHVLVVNYCWCGFVAAVYKFTETPEETGLSECECRLALCKKIGVYFRGWRSCNGVGLEPGSLNPCGKEILYENVSD